MRQTLLPLPNPSAVQESADLAPVAELAEADGEAEGGRVAPEAAEPQTRAELQELQARLKSNLRVAALFYHQRWVQIEMRIIYLGADPLFREYQNALKEQKLGQAANQHNSI